MLTNCNEKFYNCKMHEYEISSHLHAHTPSENVQLISQFFKKKLNSKGFS